jgi:hypothetical protein
MMYTPDSFPRAVPDPAPNVHRRVALIATFVLGFCLGTLAIIGWLAWLCWQAR